MGAGSSRLGGSRRRWTNPAALGLYGFVAFLYFGLAVAAHPGRTAIGRGTDGDIFIWSFGWWPHALLHGENPVFTHAIWAPVGLDLAWAAVAPGVALLFSPVTLAVGPVAAYNVAAVVLPALAAWTAYLLCREVTHAVVPSLAGGYVFGFSSYLLGQEEGHVHMTAVFLLPLVALVVLRALHGTLGGRGLSLRLGILLAAQLWFSTELFTTLTLALGVALALAFALARAVRPQLRSLARPLAASYGLACLLGSPLLYYALTDFRTRSVTVPDASLVDLANFVVPTQLTAAGGGWAASFSAKFPSNEAEQAGYVGIPMLVLLVLLPWYRRREPGTRLVVASFLVAAVAACGIALHVDGDRVVALPWRLIAHLPVFDNIVPARLMVFATLAAAVAVALFASSRAPAWLRAALPALAVLALVPNLGQAHDHWIRTVKQPAFFTHHRYERCLRAGDNLLVIPYGKTGDALVWQTESNFSFRMAGGDVGPLVPAPFAGDAVNRLLAGDVRHGDVLALARRAGVSAVVVDETDPFRFSFDLAGLGAPRSVGGMLLYPLRPGTAASTAATCS